MKPENVQCPNCGGPMVSRLNGWNGRRFWGCARFPGCRGTRDTDGKSADEREAERAPDDRADSDAD